MKTKKLTACLAAALLLTGCGSVTVQIPAGTAPVTEAVTGTTVVSGSETAAQTAFTTAFTGDTSAANTDASTADTTAVQTTAAQTAAPQTDPPQTAPPAPEPEPAAQPKLMARCIKETIVSGGNLHGLSASVTHKYVNAGEQLEVASLDVDDHFSNNYIDFKIGDEPVYTGVLQDFVLLPNEEYVASLSDAELNTLAAALYFQYADLFRQFAWSGGTLNLTGTGETREISPGMCYERMTPVHTWNDLMNEMHQFFTADYVICGTNGNEDLSFYIREFEGCLWRISGIGQISLDTYVSTSGVRSRSADEIVFDMRVTRDDTMMGGSGAAVNETFIIHLEDGIWKCREVPLEWNMT